MKPTTYESDNDVNFAGPTERRWSRSRDFLSPDNQLQVIPPIRRCRSASRLPPRSPLLASEQKILIKQSWQKISHSALGQAIYSKMLNLNESIKLAFNKDAKLIDRHKRYFIELLQCAVNNLDDTEEALKPFLELIGKGHAEFKVRLEILPFKATVSTNTACYDPTLNVPAYLKDFSRNSNRESGMPSQNLDIIGLH